MKCTILTVYYVMVQEFIKTIRFSTQLIYFIIVHVCEFVTAQSLLVYSVELVPNYPNLPNTLTVLEATYHCTSLETSYQLRV